MTRILLGALLLSLSACDLRAGNGQDTTPAGAVPSNLVLRSYDVPNNGAQRLRGVLKDLLWFGNDSKDSNKFVGRADVGPDGRLIVLAPESVHAGVSNLVASLASKPIAEPGAVRIDYWVVAGTPGKSDALPAGLQEVSPALAEVEKNDGPMAFVLVEKLTVTSLSNERGSLDGRDTHVRQFTNVVDTNVTADLSLERFGQRLETRVRVKPGALVVLASSGMTAPKDANEPARSIYFLARATLSDGTGR